MKKLASRAFVNAITTAAYIVLVVLFIQAMGNSFGDEPETILIPIAMLLLFVFSAALTGSLVFGKPAMLYFDGKKREAFLLLTYTLGFILIVTLTAFLILIVFQA